MKNKFDKQMPGKLTRVSLPLADGQPPALQQNNRFLVQAQYEQLHEMRREYNRVLFQAPTLVVTVVGTTLAVLSFLLSGNQTTWLKSSIGLIIFISIAGFVFALGYWALRSRILLRSAERTLKIMEQTYGSPDQVMYPYEVNTTLPAWQRWPSSLLIVIYIFLLGVAFLITGLIAVVAVH